MGCTSDRADLWQDRTSPGSIQGKSPRHTA
jgi:hypothetical protein